MHLVRSISAAGMAAVVAWPAGAAEDLPLTGVWEGLQVCDDVDGGVQQNFVTDDRVEITQRGERIRLRRIRQDRALDLFYEGPVMPLEGSPRVEAMVTVCGGNYEARETVRLRRVRTDSDGGGTFDAESLYMSSDVSELPGIQIFGTCKWAYERVSTRDPNVPRC
jgi:hypothetical protein